MLNTLFNPHKFKQWNQFQRNAGAEKVKFLFRAVKGVVSAFLLLSLQLKHNV